MTKISFEVLKEFYYLYDFIIIGGNKDIVIVKIKAKENNK